MNLTELRNAVYAITNRPDMVGQTLTAIQSSTLKAHQSDFFYKDLYETGIAFSTAAYQQSFEPATLTGTPLERYRALKYARKSDAQGGAGIFFDLIIPELVLDDYSYERTNVMYAAGDTIQFKSNTLFQYMIFGAYINPNITEAGYSSWIARDHPFCIVYDAAARILKQIGKDGEFQAMNTEVTAQYAELKISNIVANGV